NRILRCKLSRVLDPNSTDLIELFDNPYVDFIKQKCTSGFDYSVEFKDLYKSYKIWCSKKKKNVDNFDKFRITLKMIPLFQVYHGISLQGIKLKERLDNHNIPDNKLKLLDYVKNP